MICSSRCGLSLPSPTMTSFTFGNWVATSFMASTKYFRPLRSWSSAMEIIIRVSSLAWKRFSLMLRRSNSVNLSSCDCHQTLSMPFLITFTFALNLG